ncbi:hypothetical protein WN943_027540 [Citrus x changshan-huyou]
MVVTRQPRPRKVTDKDTPKAIDKNRNRSGISQSRFGALAELTNEDMHPQDYDDDSVSHREPMISIPENIQTLGPKSQSMKKKLTNLPIRKLSTRKATNPIHLSQPTTENLDPNIQILSNYSYPNSQPPTMHGMHAKHDLFPTPVPCTKSSAPSTSMHGMHDPKQPISNTPAPDPVPVPTTLNPLHHKAVSFPKVALAPKAIAQYPSQRVCDSSLANEPPDKGTPCDFNSWETTAEPEESPVTSRSKSSLAANVCSVDAENGMEVEVTQTMLAVPIISHHQMHQFELLDSVISICWSCMATNTISTFIISGSKVFGLLDTIGFNIIPKVVLAGQHQA